MANFLYNSGKKSFFDGGVDWDNDTVKILLVNNSYSPLKSHKTVADVLIGSTELTGSGYDRKTLTNCTVVQDDINDRVLLSADDAVWNSIQAGTAKGAVIFKDSGIDSSSTLIAYIDSAGFPIETIGSNLILEFSNSGLIKLN